MKPCPKCGATIPASATFCGCGYRWTAASGDAPWGKRAFYLSLATALCFFLYCGSEELNKYRARKAFSDATEAVAAEQAQEAKRVQLEQATLSAASKIQGQVHYELAKTAEKAILGARKRTYTADWPDMNISHQKANEIRFSGTGLGMVNGEPGNYTCTVTVELNADNSIAVGTPQCAYRGF
ncbi:hypothetical protein EON81_23760 [bacterium]|nr:MAG: hypothetical protein EON81_23760 [bacterium]